MSAAPPGQLPPPQVQLMQMAMGFSAPFLLRAAAELRLADHLANGPKTAGEISAITGTHAPALYRLLLEKAGFKFSRVIPTNSNVSIVEAIPA
ncbi:MAG: hypothetical protein WB646_00645 [Steroidobacteraceae bacterium]